VKYGALIGEFALIASAQHSEGKIRLDSGAFLLHLRKRIAFSDFFKTRFSREDIVSPNRRSCDVLTCQRRGLRIISG
jgi:hypothetical protein